VYNLLSLNLEQNLLKVTAFFVTVIKVNKRNNTILRLLFKKIFLCRTGVN